MTHGADGLEPSSPRLVLVSRGLLKSLGVPGIRPYSGRVVYAPQFICSPALQLPGPILRATGPFQASSLPFGRAALLWLKQG